MYIQTRFDRQNTACDDCILWTTCIISWAVCIANMVMDVPDEIENCVDCMIQIVNGCMLAQQQNEVNHIKRVGYAGPSQNVMQVLSPHQQELMCQGKPAQQQMGGMGGAPIGMPVNQSPGQFQMGRDCSSLDWDEMQPHEMQAARLLGYNPHMWDNDIDGPYADYDFRQLNQQCQQAVLTLGISQQKWDSS